MVDVAVIQVVEHLQEVDGMCQYLVIHLEPSEVVAEASCWVEDWEVALLDYPALEEAYQQFVVVADLEILGEVYLAEHLLVGVAYQVADQAILEEGCQVFPVVAYPRAAFQGEATCEVLVAVGAYLAVQEAC